MNRAGKAKYWVFILVFLLLAAAIAAAGFVFLRHEKRQNADIEQLQNVAGALSVPREEVVPEIRRLQQGFLTELDEVFSAGQLNAYQKLASGRDISLLIVGDSIGALPWTSDVAAWIEENYQVSCTIKNISLGGNMAYSGYVTEKLLDDGIAYDLVIVCYGQNDLPEGFSADYEALIREVLSKNNLPCVISVLESSQREYTEKMQAIQSIAAYYGIETADTIAAFENSGYSYETLSSDGIHPNGYGQAVYASTVEDIIRTCVEKEFVRKRDIILSSTKDSSVSPSDYFYSPSLPTPMDPSGIAPYESFRYYPSEAFTRISDTEWQIRFDTPQKGLLGISRSRCPGENLFEIYNNEELFYSEEDYHSIGFNLMKISKTSSEPAVFEGDLRIKFLEKEHADSFFGIIFTDYEELN